MKVFKTPKESLGALEADVAAAIIATAADIALIVDGEGTILDASFHRMDLSAELEGNGRFLGRPWSETVAAESQPKVATILREAAGSTASRWRQINHVSASGGDIPILYSAVSLGDSRYVALGRDLRAAAKLEQRLLEAQMAMERDYSRLRHAETRYRIMFQMSSEAVLIVDGGTQRIVEANPAALRLFNDTSRAVVGRGFVDVFDVESMSAARTLLSDVRSAGRVDAAKLRLPQGGEFLAAASLFRHDTSTLILVRLASASAEGAIPPPSGKTKLSELVQRAPDGHVVTDRRGTIVAANPAFLDMAQLTVEEQVRGEPLDRWLGRPGIDLNVVMANLRQHGSVRLFSTILRGEYGAGTDVEVSAVELPDDEEKLLGFSIRNVGLRLRAEPRGEQHLPRSAEQLTELIGRVPLKDIVRETADVIERLCIEAALKMTGDNRASASEMLGLSRQSLYVKLRRYGLAEGGNEPDTQHQVVES